MRKMTNATKTYLSKLFTAVILDEILLETRSHQFIDRSKTELQSVGTP